MSTTEVGTAHVVIRAITDKVKDDIKKSFTDAFKGVEDESRKAGDRSGRAFGDGFRDGLRSANISGSLSTHFNKIESDAAIAGDRAATAYANAYKQRLQQQLNGFNPNPNPSNGNPPIPVPGPQPSPSPSPPNPPTPPSPPSGGGGGNGPTPSPGGNGPRDADNESRRLLGTIRDLKRQINTLGDSTPFRAMTGAIGVVNASLRAMIPIALAATAATAFQGAIGAIGGVIGGLNQMISLLAVVPALGVAAGAGIATLVMGFSGVGGALKAMGAQAKEAQKTGADEAEKHRQALRAVASAANGVVTAQHAVKSAQDSLTDAQKNAYDAQKDLNQAYTDAARGLRDMNLELEGSKLSAEEAQYAVQDAALALMKANTDPGATQLERQKADLNYRQALLRLKQQKIEVNDLAQDTAKANQAGIDGSERVVNAKQAEIQAQRGLADAQFNLSQAIRGLGEAQQNLADAQRKLNEEQKEGSAAADKLAEAMAKLSPAGQDLVKKIYGLKDAWTDLRKTTQEYLLSGWGDAFTNMANAQIPVLKTGLSTIAGQLNLIGKDVMATFSDPTRMQQWGTVLDRIAGMFNQMRPGFQFLLDGFLDLVNIGAEYLPRFGQWFTDISRTFRVWAGDTEYVNQRIENAIAMTQGLWDVVSGLAGTWGAIFNTGAVVPMIEALGDLSLQMESWAKSTEGQIAIFTFFDNATQALETLGPILSPVLEGLTLIGTSLVQLETAGASGIAALLEGILSGLRELAPVADDFGAAVGRIGAAFAPVAAQLGGELRSAIMELLPTLVQAGELFAALAGTLAPLLPVAAEFVTAAMVPLHAIMAALIPILEIVVATLETFTPILTVLAPAIGVAVLALMGFLKTQQVIATTTLFLTRLGTQATATTGSLVALGAAAQAAGSRVAGGLTGATGSVRSFGQNAVTSFRDSVRSMQQANPAMSTFGASMRTMGGMATGAFGAIRSGAGSALAALGGPWMIGIMAVVTVVSSLAAASDDAAKMQEQLTSASHNLANAQEEVRDALIKTNGAMTGDVMSSLTEQVSTYRDELQKTADAAPGFWAETWAFLTEAPRQEIHQQIDDMQEIGRVSEEAAKAIKQVGFTDQDIATALAGTDGDWQVFVGKLREVGTWGDAAVKALQEQRDELFRQEEALKTVTPGMTDLTDAMKVLADETSTAEDKASALRKALEAMGVIQVDKAETATRYGEAIRNITENAKDAITATAGLGDQLYKNGELDLVGNANAAQLSDTMIDLSESFHAQAMATGNAHQAYQDAIPALNTIRETYKLNDEQYNALLRSYGMTPELIETFIQVRGADSVEQQLVSVATKIDSIEPGKPKTVTVVGLTDDAQTRLRDLGYTVETLPNGTFRVTPRTEDANLALDMVYARLDELGIKRTVAGIYADDTSFRLTNRSVLDDLRNIDLTNVAPEIRSVIDNFLQGKDVTWAEIAKLDLAKASPEVQLAIQQALDNANILNTELAKLVGQERVVRVRAAITDGASTAEAWNAGFGVTPEEYARMFPDSDRARQWREAQGRATGGPILGPGTGTSDSIPAWLSNGEHVLTAEEVERLGGQDAVLRMRQAIMSGTMPRFAEGGGVGGGSSLGVNLTGLGSMAMGMLNGARDLPGISQIADAWGSLSAGLADTTDKVIAPVFRGVNTGLAMMGEMFRDQSGNIVLPTWAEMAVTMTQLKDQVIAPTIAEVGAGVAATATRMQTNINEIANPVWTAMSDHMLDVKTNGIDPTLAGIQGGVDTTVESFRAGTDMIGTHFATIQQKTHDPVKWTVDNVINAGVVGAWNSVAGIIGTPPLVPFQYMAEGGLVTGGVPDKDSVPAMLMPGEVVITKEAVGRVGADRLLALNKGVRAGANETNLVPLATGPNDPNFKGGHAPRVPGFAAGGIVQPGVDITSEIQRSMWDAVRTAFPNAILTSGTRYQDVGSGYDHHMGQRALDLGGPMPEIARWIYEMNATQPVEELIHWPLAGWQNLEGGAPFDFGAGTNAQHMDHVHWAMNQMVGSDGRLISMAAGGGPGRAIATTVQNTVRGIIEPILNNAGNAVGGLSVPGAIGTLPGVIYDKTRAAVTQKIMELAALKDGRSGSALTGNVPFDGTAGVEQWRPLVEKILAEKGIPLDKADLVLYQMKTESSGDPNALNDWDENWQKGTPSKGLMQVIDPTFQSYKDPGYDDIWDPESNIRASINYALRDPKYGSLDAAYRGVGYDQGGWLPPGENQKVYNATGQPEAILNPGQWSSVQDAIKLATQIVQGAGIGGVGKEIASIAINAQSVVVNGPLAGAGAALGPATAGVASYGSSAVGSAVPATPDPLASYGGPLPPVSALPNTPGSTSPMGSDKAIAEAELVTAKADLEVALNELTMATDEAQTKTAQDRIDQLKRRVQELEAKLAGAESNATVSGTSANSAVAQANYWTQQGSTSPEALAAQNNTMGAAPINTGTFNNNSTDPNDPAFNNPYTDPALNDPAKQKADQLEAYRQKFAADAGEWRKNAEAEILDQFLEPIGLSTSKLEKMGQMTGFAKEIGEQTALAMANRGIMAVNTQLGIPNQPGLAATPGAPAMPGTVVFNGMDPQKAMDELSRLIGMGMQGLSRYR